GECNSRPSTPSASAYMPTAASWKIVRPIPLLAGTSDPQLFRVAPSPGLFRELGVSLKDAYVPQVWEPTVVFHAAVASQLRREGRGSISRPRLPYLLNVPWLNSAVKLSLRFRVFSPGVLSLSVHLAPSEVAFDVDFLT